MYSQSQAPDGGGTLLSPQAWLAGEKLRLYPQQLVELHRLLLPESRRCGTLPGCQ